MANRTPERMPQQFFHDRALHDWAFHGRSLPIAAEHRTGGLRSWSGWNLGKWLHIYTPMFAVYVTWEFAAVRRY
jgi:hypothetical protein